MRVVQLSDPHLVASPTGQVRGRPALRHWRRGLEEALVHRPDLLLISGDCCHDESWNGYAVLRDSLAALPANTAVAVVPGNHDHPPRLRAALGRRATVAPGVLALGCWPWASGA
jgi:Icc protein